MAYEEALAARIRSALLRAGAVTGSDLMVRVGPAARAGSARLVATHADVAGNARAET